MKCLVDQKYVICQKFITDIKKGDTRILVANGKVYEDVLVRYPPKMTLDQIYLMVANIKSKKLILSI